MLLSAPWDQKTDFQAPIPFVPTVGCLQSRILGVVSPSSLCRLYSTSKWWWKHGVESKILFDVNAVSTGKSIRRRNRKCRFSCPRVYFVTLTTSRKFSEPQFPYLQVRDVNSNLLQGWCENSGPSADCMHGQLCDIPFTLHEILRYRGRNRVCERTSTRSGGSCGEARENPALSTVLVAHLEVLCKPQ